MTKARIRASAGYPKPATDAARPHVDVAVAAEEVRIGEEQFVEALFQYGGDFRVMFVAESAVPNGAIDDEEADRVIVITLFQIPAIAGMIGGDPEQVALEEFAIDFIALQLEP